MSLSVRSSLSKLSSRLDVLDFMASVLDANPIAGTAMGDMGFGVVADIAVVVACLPAFWRLNLSLRRGTWAAELLPRLQVRACSLLHDQLHPPLASAAKF